MPRPGPPTGQVRINPLSPQAAGLVECWPPIASRGTSSVRGLRGGLPLTLTGASIGLKPYGEWAAALNGDTATAQVADADRFDIRAFTLALWLRTTVSPSVTAIVLEKWNEASGPYPYVMRVNPSGTPFAAVYDGTNFPQITGGTTVNDGLWHLLVFTSAGASAALNLYVDGKSDAAAVTNTATGTIANNYPLSFSYRPGTSSFRLTGDYGEVRFYDRALSAALVYQMWDPRTRWDLYEVRRPRRGFVAAAPGDPRYPRPLLRAAGDSAIVPAPAVVW